MVGMRQGATVEEIATELKQKAAQLWGQARATQLDGPLNDMAEFLHQVAENLPDREDEPAFFL